MKSFKDFEGQNAGEATKRTEESVCESTATAEELTKKIATAYNGKSSADMLRNILAEAEKSKRAGTLTNEEIDSFYLAFSPMLDHHQRKKLRAVVDRLKEI